MMKSTVFSVVPHPMVLVVCTVRQRNITMVLEQINVAGVVLYQTALVACIAPLKIMKNNIPLILLKDIAKISKGVWLTPKLKHAFSQDELEEIYGTQKDDIVIKRDIYSPSKKIAVLVKDSSITVIPNGASLIIRPDIEKLWPVYLKAFLEYLPADKVIKTLKITNKKRLLSEGSLSKLMIPLPELDEQIRMTSQYGKLSSLSSESFYTYSTTMDEYNSLSKFFWETSADFYNSAK